jgi:8-oxo-dGTP pyrophosphatase MutT (NUDIX family)
MEPDGLQEDKEEKRVSKVVIFDKKGKVLILKRADRDKDWDLPGGHVEEGETFEDGARRETKEETSLDIDKLNFLKKEKRIKFYIATCPEKSITLQDEEHTDYKWIKPSEIDEYETKEILRNAIIDAADKKKLKKEQTEPYQRKVRQGHRKMKIRLIGKGGQKNSPPYTKKPPMKRSKSAPPAG